MKEDKTVNEEDIKWATDEEIEDFANGIITDEEVETIIEEIKTGTEI